MLGINALRDDVAEKGQQYKLTAVSWTEALVRSHYGYTASTSLNHPPDSSEFQEVGVAILRYLREEAGLGGNSMFVCLLCSKGRGPTRFKHGAHENSLNEVESRFGEPRKTVQQVALQECAAIRGSCNCCGSQSSPAGDRAEGSNGVTLTEAKERGEHGKCIPIQTELTSKSRQATEGDASRKVAVYERK
jgi:hypothetical protein